MFPNFIPKQEQQQIPIWRYSSNAAQIQLARPPKLTYFEVENLLSKTDEDNYVPAIFVRSCNGIRGYGGRGNSINYKIPTELVWLGKFDCPEIIEEGFLNNFEFFLHPKPPLFAMDHQNDPKRYMA